MKYDVDYFIQKFEAIPDEKWGTGVKAYDFYADQKCALGHCRKGEHEQPSYSLLSDEGRMLCDLLSRVVLVKGSDFSKSVWYTNDAEYKDLNWRNSNPKQRILAALYDVKKLLQPEVIKGEFKPVTFSQIEIPQHSVN